MKSFSLFLSTIIIFSLSSCEKEKSSVILDDKPSPIHTLIIESPTEYNLKLNSKLKIRVKAETSGEKMISHINVKVYHATDSTIVYEEPKHGRAYPTDGVYTFSGELVLSNVKGVFADNKYIIEAQIWGKDKETDFLKTSTEFEVIPK